MAARRRATSSGLPHHRRMLKMFRERRPRPERAAHLTHAASLQLRRPSFFAAGWGARRRSLGVAAGVAGWPPRSWAPAHPEIVNYWSRRVVVVPHRRAIVGVHDRVRSDGPLHAFGVCGGLVGTANYALWLEDVE